MFRTILSKSLRDYRVPILCWGYGLGLFMLLEIAATTPALVAAYAQIAPAYRFLGDPVAMQTPEGYITARLLEAFLPILICIWPILAGARLVRGEEERGTMDVLLATPQSRLRLILEKLFALVIALLVIVLLIAILTVVGEAKANIQVDFVRALFLALNAGLLAFFFATLALLISQFTNNRGTASGVASGLLVLAFVFDGTGRVVNGSWIQYLSPFYYYNLNRPLLTSFNDTPLAALLLLGLSLLFAVGSVVLFARRDSGRSLWAWQSRQNGNHQIERSLQRARREISVRSINLRALKSQAGASFWWLLGIAFWCAWLVPAIPNVEKPFKSALAQSPGLAKIISSSAFASDAGMVNEIVFTFVIVIVVIFALTLALSWSSDLENGRLELILATPRSRTRMMLERFAAVLLMALLAAVLCWLFTFAAAQATHLNIQQGPVIAASLSMLPLMLITIGLTYALAGRLRYGAVLGILTGYIALAFLGEFLQSLLQLPDWTLSLSIFHLYGTPLLAGMDWSSFLGMTAVGLALLAIGLFQFRYADIERG